MGCGRNEAGVREEGSPTCCSPEGRRHVKSNAIVSPAAGNGGIGAGQ
jgi:hypothetical protein